jgi:ABC-type nitrate/sulfonate/bicarbonate transport system substrate-binding protein
MQSSYINDAEFIGYFIAIDKGYYRARGLNFVYRPGGPDIIPESALFSKKADVALTDIDTTVSAITKQGAKFKIIGAQFQKNPMGVISLPNKPVRTPQDLIGKSLSVSPVSMALVRAFFRIVGLPANAVRIVPDLQSDPSALLTGVVDAALGFVSDYPFVVAQHGKQPITFLLGDYGMPQFMDTVVVDEDTLKSKREALVQWLAASRQGWNENFVDPAVYPRLLHETWLKPAGRSADYDAFSNRAYKQLMTAKTGVFSMSEQDIAYNIEAVNRLGLKATRAMFDTTLLQEIH